MCELLEKVLDEWRRTQQSGKEHNGGTVNHRSSSRDGSEKMGESIPNN
jgi:hypothetical protein